MEAGTMEGVEILFLTENSMSEAVYYQGNLSDKDIFELMLWFFYLEPRRCFRLHTIWVTGMRQIAAVIDGFPRGCLTDRIASYGYILDFVTLNET